MKKLVVIAAAITLVMAPAYAAPNFPKMDSKAYCQANNQENSEIIQCLNSEKVSKDWALELWEKLSDENKDFCTEKASTYHELHLCAYSLAQ
jgi:hypothetical protein